jgi:signal transduction histidine kinase
LTRLTRPLDALAVAAEGFGRGEANDPLEPVGPREVHDLTAAFNTMQNRITRFVADRTQMLAALAHDLRSPLTALRVQAELVNDAETRDALSQSLDEMTAMTEATLAFAKGVGRNEAAVSVEIGDIVAAAATDARASVAKGAPVVLRLRRQAVIRALRNLIENALRYGAAARVSWQVTDGHLEIRVDDDGPGIPEEEIDRVVTPYYRLETSRSQETGGHGLGLAITRSVALSHGGELSLENRAGGGLRAVLRLPIIHDEARATPEATDATKDP